MKSILIPEDEGELKQMIEGWKWELVAWKLQQDCMKHGYLRKIEDSGGAITMEVILGQIDHHMQDLDLNFTPDPPIYK